MRNDSAPMSSKDWRPGWWVRRWGSPVVEREFMSRWGRLVRYNDEVGRGIQHRPEYDAEMAELQRQYNAEYFGQPARPAPEPPEEGR